MSDPNLRLAPSEPVTFEQDAQRAADLLNAQEVSGWELAELTAARTLTSPGRPTAQERAAGRVSSEQWARAVSERSKRQWSRTTASTYAMCWRRYGHQRLTDEAGHERTFAEHLQAAKVAEDQAEQAIRDWLSDDRREEWRTRNLPPTGEIVATQVQEAIKRDPAILKDLVRDPEFNEAIAEARYQVRREEPRAGHSVGSAPEVAQDPNEQALDRACRAIDELLLNNDMERIGRLIGYLKQQVPQKLQALDWWQREQDELEARRAERAAKKAAR